MPRLDLDSRLLLFVLVTRTAFSGISRCIWSSDSAQSIPISARLWILLPHFDSYVPGVNDVLGQRQPYVQAS
ncbi:hypothetical protein BDW72DRAFT_158160 [Aspergillus terricola var. indicus]